jgi:hypothetical protein
MMKKNPTKKLQSKLRERMFAVEKQIGLVPWMNIDMKEKETNY